MKLLVSGEFLYLLSVRSSLLAPLAGLLCVCHGL